MRAFDAARRRPLYAAADGATLCLRAHHDSALMRAMRVRALLRYDAALGGAQRR